MPRPTSKVELIASAHHQFDTMGKLIDAMPCAAQELPFSLSDEFLATHKEAHWQRDKNLRDVLTHLYEWHMLLLNWVSSNKAGEEKPFLPAPYTWKTYGDMNMKFWEQHQNTTLEQAKDMLSTSHAKVVKLLEAFSDDELFIKKYFSWTGTTTLASYCISASSSHYDWAIKKIKHHRKTCSS
jgi:hypothetical protein